MPRLQGVGPEGEMISQFSSGKEMWNINHPPENEKEAQLDDGLGFPDVIIKVEPEDEPWLSLQMEQEKKLLVSSLQDKQTSADASSGVNPEKRHATLCSAAAEDVDTTEQVTWAVAESSMENILRFFEQNPIFTMEEVMQAHILRNTMITKKQESMRQRDRKVFEKNSYYS